MSKTRKTPKDGLMGCGDKKEDTTPSYEHVLIYKNKALNRI